MQHMQRLNSSPKGSSPSRGPEVQTRVRGPKFGFQTGELRVGLVQIGLVQMGVVQMGVVQMGLFQMRVVQTGLVQMGKVQTGAVERGVDRCRAGREMQMQGCFSVPRKPSPRGGKASALQCRKGCKSERERKGRLHENLAFLPRELRR